MGILLISILLVAFGFVCWYFWRKAGYWDGEGWCYGAFCGWFFGGIILLVCLVCGICASVNEETLRADLIEQRASIEYRLEQCENEDNLLVNGGTYTDILEYNKKVRLHKRWAHNFWVGIFWEDAPAEMEYIKLPESVS